MSSARLRARIPDLNAWLLSLLFLLVPTHVAPAYWVCLAMLVLGVIEGGFRQKWESIRTNDVFWVFQLYFCIVVIGLLWTEDMHDGRRMVSRAVFFLVFPVFLGAARARDLPRHLMAFLAGVTACELLAFYNWLQLHVLPWLPPGIRVDKDPFDTAPFVDRALYTPILAMAGYVAIHQLLFAARTRGERVLLSMSLLMTFVNLVISGGRTGQVAFLVAMSLATLQRFARRPALGGTLAILLCASLAGTAYLGSGYFRERVNMAIDEATSYQSHVNSSVGHRITYTLNSLRLIREHPLIGVGTGDFREEYARINARYTPAWEPAFNPHNQFLFALTTTGTLGGIALLLVYLPPALWRMPYGDGYDRLRVALPVIFVTISMFESFLWRTNTSLMFVLFSAILYASPHVRGPASPSKTGRRDPEHR